MQLKGSSRVHPEPDSLVETHISRVICQGDRAFKVKKPVKTDFIDLRDRDERRRLCEREVELNSRLAPDVYLGVTEYEHEPAVVMRRMPEDRRLSTLVKAGADVQGDLRAIARIMASFHSRADRGDIIDHAGMARAVHYLWAENLSALSRYPDVVKPDLVQRLRELSDQYIAGRVELFDARIAAGKVCDGHGDLLADDIFCLDDGPRILDCVEFNDTFRFADVLADVAFLAMDLERLGRQDMGKSFLRAYQEFSADTAPRSLADLYIAYRALVRAKVACLRHEQGDAHAADEARWLLDICWRHLERAQCVFVMIGGLPGSGKSTVAQALGERLGWAVISSDDVRHDVAGIGRATRASAPFEAGIYEPEMTSATYRELTRRAIAMLRRGESVIVDATWANHVWRELAAVAVHDAHSDLAMIRCHAAHSTLMQRIVQRPAVGAALTDAQIAARLERGFEPWPDGVPVDTDAPIRRSLATALDAIAMSRWADTSDS